MSSELRVNKLTNTTGINTITFATDDATFSGNVSIAGTLTYVDLANIDAVGIITAQSDVSIADKIIHTGDTNTAIRFPSTDTFTVETGGTERLRITTDKVMFSADAKVDSNNARDLGASGSKWKNLYLASLASIGGAQFNGNITPTTGEGVEIFQAATGVGQISSFDRTNSDWDALRVKASQLEIFTEGTERLRITSAGQVLIAKTDLVSHPNMDDLQIGDSTGNRGITISSGDAAFGTVAFGDSADGSGTDRYEGFVEYYHNDNSMRFGTSHVEKIRIDSAGSLLIGPAGAPATTITAAGAITTAGTIDVAGPIGNGEATTGVSLGSYGQVTVQRAAGSGIWSGYQTGTGGHTSRIYGSGAAEFAGNVISGADAYAGANNGVRLYNSGTVFVSRTGTSNTVFEGYTTGTSTATSKITASGSATFAGALDVGSEVAFGGVLRPLTPSNSASNGVYFKSRNAAHGGATSVGILETGLKVGDFTSNLGATEAIKLNTNGSATFTSTVINLADPRTGSNNGVCLDGGSGISATTTDDGSHYPIWRGYKNGTSTPTSQINVTGTATFGGTVTCTSVTETSDQRFKKNITDANPQLADVTALGEKLRNWDWTDDAPVYEKDTRFLGLIAQEVESICPGIIHTVPRTKDGEKELTAESTDEDGNVTPATYEQVDDSYNTIKTSVLIMKLLGAVTELSAKVAALEGS